MIPLPSDLYQRLGQLIETMPSFSTHPLAAEDHLWLGRALLAVEQSETGVAFDAASFKHSADRLATSRGGPMRANEVQQIATIMYRALARAEASAPATAQGNFIPVGKPLDAFMAVGKVLATAKKFVRIVDPYLDHTAVSDFAVLAAEGVSVQLLGAKGRVKEGLKPASQRFVAQFGNKRPLDVRLAESKLLHDRLIDVDGLEVWIVTQSFNALAARSPATLSKAPTEVAADKISFYSDLWASADPL